MPETPRCDFHDVALVEYRAGWWACPIAALHDLANQFDQVYQANYAPAPTAENGIYHHARAVLATWRA